MEKEKTLSFEEENWKMCEKKRLKSKKKKLSIIRYAYHVHFQISLQNCTFYDIKKINEIFMSMSSL